MENAFDKRKDKSQPYVLCINPEKEEGFTHYGLDEIIWVIRGEEDVQNVSLPSHEQVPRIPFLYADGTIQGSGRHIENMAVRKTWKGLFSGLQKVLRNVVVEDIIIEIPESDSLVAAKARWLKTIVLLTDLGYNLWWIRLNPRWVCGTKSDIRYLVVATLFPLTLAPINLTLPNGNGRKYAEGRVKSNPDGISKSCPRHVAFACEWLKDNRGFGARNRVANSRIAKLQTRVSSVQPREDDGQQDKGLAKRDKTKTSKGKPDNDKA